MRYQSEKSKSHHVKFNRFDNPSEREIPGLWFELRALSELVPEGERGGVHRLRTALLRSIPRYELPAFLDRLQEATA